MKSWKTTLAGVLQFLAIVSVQVGFMLDMDPATTMDWSIVMASLITLIGLFTARDNDVTSEDAGVARIQETGVAKANPVLTNSAEGSALSAGQHPQGDPHQVTRERR